MTFVVTSATGGTAQVVEVTYIPPERQVLDAGADTKLSSTGLDPASVADLLSACLAHERCGVHLYRSVSGRSMEPSLVSQYEHFGEETAEHVRFLEELITAAGGDPQYVSPAARATEKAASALLECTFMISGSVDNETAELMMLEAVMLAEAKDRANWEVLTQLAGQMADGDFREQLASLTDIVLSQEIEHHSWARDTRATLLITRAGSAPSAAAPEETSSESVTAVESSKDALYEAAKDLDIQGRSQMSKDELADAVAHARKDSR